MKKKILVILITMTTVFAVCFSLYLFVNKKNSVAIETPNTEVLQEDTVLRDPDAVEHRKIYDDNTCNNPDYRGQIVFESGLIDRPFVQTGNNDFYLRRDYKTYAYSMLGTVFMDYECGLDSQNVILYGHNAFSTFNAGLDENGNPIDHDTLMFTALKHFTDKEFYEQNKYVDLILSDRINKYIVVSSFYANVVTIDGVETLNDDFYYFIPEYDRDYFVYYKQNIKAAEFYDTGVDFSYDDKLLTLQTCVEGNDNLRQVVLCKKLETLFY